MRSTYSDVFLAIFCIITPLRANIFRFYLQPPPIAQVTQLVEGKINRIQQGSVLISSVTLIEDGGYFIIVDSPSATDLTSKEIMLKGLMTRNLVPGQIQLIVTTHGHPDHFGQGNFFPNARHFFASYEYTGTTFIRTELYQAETMKLTKNTELWNTPGHTSQDVTLIVRNTKCCGTIAVVGDLFYSQSDAIDSKDWDLDAWDKITGQYSRRRVICTVDHIVPGHGKMFRVTNQMREEAQCDMLITRKTLINVTQPSLGVTASIAKLPESKSESSPTTKILEPTVETPVNKNFPISNSILPDNYPIEKKSPEMKDQGSELSQTNPGTKTTEKSLEEKSQVGEIIEFQLMQPLNNARTTIADTANILPVTAAQDITHFQGIGKEQFLNKNADTITTELESKPDERVQIGELVGSIVYPTRASSLNLETQVLRVHQVPENASTTTVKRFDKVFNNTISSKVSPANSRAVTVTTTNEKKGQGGILPALENAANQFALMFNEKSVYSPNGVPYMKIIQTALNKLFINTSEKSSR